MPEASETPRPVTPVSVIVALCCFAFAVAAPFIGNYQAAHARHDGWGALEALLPWMLAAVIAAAIGIVCTLVGARRAPRTGVTIFAFVLACLFGAGFLWMIAVIAGR